MRNYYIILIGLAILVCFKYIDKIFNLQLPKISYLILLLAFISLSLAQIIIANNLRKETLPRRLTKKQRNKLIKDLSLCKNNYPVIVVCHTLDNESYNYATEIDSVFKESGWNTGAINKTFLDNIEGDIAIKSEGQKKMADGLANLINNVGIKCKPEKIRENSIAGIQQADTIYIIVGAKPLVTNSEDAIPINK